MAFRANQFAATLAALVVAGRCGTAVAATAEGNPYSAIVSRNVFSLVPIPVHNPADDAPQVPLPKITPTGIMTIFGNKQVVFKAPAGDPPKDKSYLLAEGEREDDITVQKISLADSTVTFDNHGTVQTLPLAKGTASGGAAPGPGGAPGGARPGIPMPRIGQPAGAPNPAFGNAAARARAAAASSAAGAGSGATPSFGAGGGTATAANANAGGEDDRALSPEAQVILTEKARMDTQEAVDKGLMPPLPPTVLTPADATAADGSPLIVSPEPVKAPAK